MPESELIGVTVSRSVADQLPKVVNLQQAIAKELELTASAEILLWDDYFAPGYGVPNDEGMEAVKLLARLEGILLDPVYTGKAMAGLIDGISQKRFKDEGPILFISYRRRACAVRLSSPRLAPGTLMQESIQLVIDSLPFLLKGAGYTLQLSIGGMIFWLTTRVYSRADAPVANLARALAGAFLYLYFSWYAAHRTTVYDLLRPAAVWYRIRSHSVSNDWSVAEHCRLCRRNAARRHFFY
mgnify:CR=1 FL=1